MGTAEYREKPRGEVLRTPGISSSLRHRLDGNVPAAFFLEGSLDGGLVPFALVLELEADFLGVDDRLDRVLLYPR
jgi:hypothetical protein